MKPDPTPLFDASAARRRVFMIFSARSLPYASVCLEGLTAQSAEPLDLHLVVDTQDEVTQLRDFIATLAAGDRHHIALYCAGDLDALAARRFAALPALRAFRDGHPCWRKITDPLLLSDGDQEMIVLDPDLFFPNAFRFEPTPERGLALMFQRPNCLLPPDAVIRAFDAGIPLADHVDIGVAQVRADAIDPAWLEGVVGALDVGRYTRFMHIEALVWSALAMRIGGGYLDATAWRCWQRGTFKRAAVAAGLPGHLTLKLEPIPRAKCLHVSGPSKYWLLSALGSGSLFYSNADRRAGTALRPFVPFTRERFTFQQRYKRAFRRLLGEAA
ncbi:hypothetical protein [Rhodobaculum claviforme]|uniref:Uncharacterized protein n=1 Tax=Rhodobaculum claviforme TaxID=1549854 RepID=A0A934TN70_9RHOB|nr:hypothetical protein [Rhodobaculum claviforme]MBK5928960.1 hypothetical protein [Rhodobaculum claviforme]